MAGWILGAIVLAVLVWQLAEAVFLGRMQDFLLEDQDYVYFFDSPALFGTQFLLFAGIASMIAAVGWQDLKKRRAALKDRTPRKTFDARQAPKRKGHNEPKHPRNRKNRKKR